MKLVLLKADGNAEAVNGSVLLNDGSRVSEATLTTLNNDGLAALGVSRVEDPPTPVGQILTGVSYAVQDGNIVAVGSFEPAPVSTEVSPLAFRMLFTAAERLAITTAGLTDAAVREFMDDASAASSIDLSHPEIQQGLAYLVSKGLLTQDRAVAVTSGISPSS